jgi:hypothetical protein
MGLLPENELPTTRSKSHLNVYCILIYNVKMGLVLDQAKARTTDDVKGRGGLMGEESLMGRVFLQTCPGENYSVKS